MTVVAYSQGILAADTQLTGAANKLRVQKIYELSDGSLVGGAGEWGECWAYIAWMQADLEGGSPHTPPPKTEGATLLRITPDGTVWLNEGNGFYPLLNKDCVAIGSGGAQAMALMEEGLSAEEAVKRVCDYDPNSSAPIITLSISPSSRQRKKSSTPASRGRTRAKRDTL